LSSGFNSGFTPSFFCRGSSRYRIELLPANTSTLTTSYPAAPMTGSISGNLIIFPGAWAGRLSAVQLIMSQSSGTPTSLTFQVFGKDTNKEIVVPETELTLSAIPGRAGFLGCAARIDVDAFLESENIYLWGKTNSGELEPVDGECFITWSE